jgi:hypothetical protein
MNAEIEQLISEYNAVEATQAARRRAIFESIAALPGYHQVRFSSGDTWDGSLLRHPDPATINQGLAKHDHTIVSAV